MAQTYYDELLQHGVPDSVPADGFCFEDLYDEHIASNQKTWKQDRRLTVGASECFACIRKTFFTKRGDELGFGKDPTYEENWGAMERGNVLENHYIVPAIEKGLERRGLELIMAGDGQDTILDGRHSATLDGLIIDPNGGSLPSDFLAYYGLEDFGEQDSVVLEMKSFDPRLTLTHEKAVHRGQTQMQMGLIREQTDYKPEYAVLMYINASWLSDIRIFVIPYDDAVYRAGRDRNTKVYSEDNPGAFAAEGKLDGMCDYCPYQGACSKVTESRVPIATRPLTAKQISEQDQKLIDSLEPKVVARDKLKTKVKSMEKEVEALNEDIKQALIAKGKSRVAGDGWKVNYTSQKGKRTLSKALMEADGLDPEKYMQEGGSFEKLTVTLKE